MTKHHYIKKKSNLKCNIIPDILGKDKTYCNVTHADNAGTKASLAYVYWKETGDSTVWENIAYDTIIMNLDELFAIGATGPYLLYYIVGKNKHLITEDVLENIYNGIQKAITHLDKLGISITYTGHKIDDLGDLTRTVFINSIITTRIKKKNIIENTGIQHEDVIIGFSSEGKTHYEEAYHSGIGNHGLTTARHELLHHTIAKKYPESFDANLPQYQTYVGDYLLTDEIEDMSNNMGQLLLGKTRTYAPVLKAILDKYTINGIIHCTDGGQTHVLNHIQNQLHISKDKLFPVPIIFQLIQCKSNIPWKDMYQIFNMGHRMEIYVKAEIVEDILDLSVKKFGLNAKVIGQVYQAKKKKLTIKYNNNIYQYE